MSGIDDLFKPYEPDPEFLISMITGMYYPANSASEADELVSNNDVLEELRNMDSQLTPKHVHDAMLGLNFKLKYIDGFLYWLVMTK